MEKHMKRWVIGGALGVLILAAPWTGSATEGLLRPAQALAAETGKAAMHTVNVNGQGEITVSPDIAYIQLGVFGKAATANAAQEEVSRTLAMVEKVLYDEYKIEKKDVKTSHFNVQPEYSYEDRKAPVVTGYTSTHMMTVNYRDLAKLGHLLDAVSKAGANRIDSIQFSTEKGEEYQLLAIEKAMANAEAKAKVMAKYAGKELKGIVHISQSGASGVPVHYAGYGMYEKQMAVADMAGGVPAPVAPGELKLSASVQVTFEF